MMPKIISWSRAQTTTLIEELRKYPILYNTKHKDFRMIHKKRLVYEKIADKLKTIKPGLVWSDVRVKLRTITKQLIVEKKRRDAALQTGIKKEQYKGTIWFYDYSKYLIDDDDDDGDDMCHEKEVSPCNEDFKEQAAPPVEDQKIRLSEIEPQQKCWGSHTNETEKVIRMWALKLRSMNYKQRMFAEKFATEILLEGELGTLHRHAVSLSVLDER